MGGPTEDPEEEVVSQGKCHQPSWDLTFHFPAALEKDDLACFTLHSHPCGQLKRKGRSWGPYLVTRYSSGRSAGMESGWGGLEAGIPPQTGSWARWREERAPASCPYALVTCQHSPRDQVTTEMKALM